MKDSYYVLAEIISNNDIKVLQDVSLFFDKPEEYFIQFKHTLKVERGINNLKELQRKPVVALNDALIRNKYALVLDWSDCLENFVTDGLLQKLNNGILKDLQCIKEIEINESEEDDSISSIFERKIESVTVNCISEAGYAVLLIDENNDSFPFAIVNESDRDKISKIGKELKLKLLFLPG